MALPILYVKERRYGIRGEASKHSLRRSEVSTDDKTADICCFPCASAQGANPPPPTTQKALTFVSAFCVRVGRGCFRSPQGELWRVATRPCGGLPLAGNRRIRELYFIYGTASAMPFCVAGHSGRLKRRSDAIDLRKQSLFRALLLTDFGGKYRQSLSETKPSRSFIKHPPQCYL